MESDPDFRRYRERHKRFSKRVEEMRVQTDSILEGLEQGGPSTANAARLDGLRRERARLFQDYLDQAGTFIEYLRRLEETKRRSDMAEKRTRSRSPRNEAQIQELSQELATKLRLARIDDAIKELLEFLADGDFFTANVTTGRRRRLRTLQSSLEKALAK